jgi:hypothetical protein
LVRKPQFVMVTGYQTFLETDYQFLSSSVGSGTKHPGTGGRICVDCTYLRNRPRRTV